jgi:hypothetical protein
MSLITFRDKNTSGTPVGPTWYLNFDALTMEELTRTAELTQYPVETGATLSDHYQPLPREISLTGVVSDTPSGPWTNLEGMQNAAAPPVMVERPLRTSPKPDQARLGPAGILRPISTSILPGRRVVQSNVERAKMYIPQFAATTLQVAGSGAEVATGTVDPSRRSGFARIPRFIEMLEGLIDGRFSVNVILQTGVEYQNMFITDMRAPRVAGSSGAITFSLDLQEVVLADPATETKQAQERAEPKQKPKKAKGRKGTKAVPARDPQLQALIDGGSLQYGGSTL